MLKLLLCFAVTLTPGYVARVIDGDTFTLYAATSTPTEERVRVLGVDAYEIRDTLGPAARSFTQEWLARGSFTIDACKRDSFGRLLALVYRKLAADRVDTLAIDLINARLGVPYP